MADKSKKRKNVPKLARERSRVDVMATRVKDKEGNIVFDGRDLYKKKPKKEA